MAAPPGGAEDKTGPSIVRSYPESGATQVERDMKVELYFSEMVNRPSVESALFLSPDPILRLRYAWSGKRLRLVYLDPLDEDKTYVVSLGSQARDLRGNPAGASTTIAFTTGDKLDEGRFHGWIAGVEKPQSISLWAYRIPKDRDPDPMTETSDYRLQAKDDGTFQFEYLKPGPYRVFAVADRDRDGLWNPGAETIGGPPWDLLVNEADDPWVSLQPILQDTAATAIQRVRQVYDDRYEIRLNHIVDSCDCRFVDSVGTELPARSAYPLADKPETWTVFAPLPLFQGIWLVDCEGIDPLNRRWQSVDTVDVAGKPDTLAPLIVRQWPSDFPATAVDPDSIVLEFDEPVFYTAEFDSFLSAISRSDTMDVMVRSDASRSIVFHTDLPMDSAGRYTIQFDGRTIVDQSGNALEDTVTSIIFAVLAKDSLGTVTGSLASPTGGQYLIEIYKVPVDKPFRTLSVSVGPFRTEPIPAGRYLARLVQDVNRNGRLDAGRMSPFEFSEPYQWSPDTIQVRARWEYEASLFWTANP